MPDDAPAHAEDRSLGAFLVSRARAASDLRLASDAGGGLIGAVAVAVFRPPMWVPLLAIAVTFAAYGAWAILDRELASEPPPDASGLRRLLLAGRAVTAVLGVTAALAGGLLLFFAALGDSWQL